MPFKPGDQVKFIDAQGGGKVLRVLDNDQLEIEDEHGFHIVVKRSEMVSERGSVIDDHHIKQKLVSFDNAPESIEKHHDASPHFKKLMKEYLMASRNNWTSRDKDFVEIDLHIEEIVKKPQKLSNGEKLILQLEHASGCMDAAIEMRMPRLIFIHGMGEGVLRSELRKWLKSFGNLEIRDARFASYGMGATEVLIRGYFAH